MKNDRNQIPLAKQKSAPGDNLTNLRDRGKSASRVEGTRRFDGLTGLNHSQSNKYMVARDLAIPTF